MKKLTFLLFILIGANTLSFAQAFKKHNVVITAGVGVGLYSTVRNYTSMDNYVSYVGSGMAAPTGVDFTVGYIIPIQLEYGIHNRWGIGLSLQPTSYSNSAAINPAKTARGNNYGLFGAFHFVNHKRFEMYGRMSFGLSSANYVENSQFSTQKNYTYTMNGGYVKPSVGMRLYFSKHIGFFGDLGVAGYRISTSSVSFGGNPVNINGGTLRTTLIGVELSTGLAFKF